MLSLALALLIWPTGAAAAPFEHECRTSICITAPIEVWDGDTWRANGHRWRLWGVSAPERYREGGLASKQALVGIIGQGPLACEPKGTSYDRTVVQCWLPDGTDVSCAMIATGHAAEAADFSGGRYAGCAAVRPRRRP